MTHRIHRICQFACTAAASCALASHAPALSLETPDFGIVDEASYQAFRSAVSQTEHVRLDFSLDPKPRIAAVTMAMMIYATKHPVAASQIELGHYALAYDTALATFAPGDPDLIRRSNFMAAVRHFNRFEDPLVPAGSDPRIGEDILCLLRMSVPEPEGFESMRDRMVQYDNARVRSLEDSPAWGNPLTLGLAGRDLNGNAAPGLAAALEIYLANQGYEPVPDGIDDDRFTDLEAALALHLPANYVGYQALLNEVNTMDLQDTSTYMSMAACFENVSMLNASIVQQICAAMDCQAMDPEPVPFRESIDNATNQAVIDSVEAAYQQSRLAVAPERAILSATSLLLLQSQQAAARDFAEVAQDFSDIQLQTNDDLAKVQAGISLAGTLAGLGVAIASKDPGDIISGVTDTVLGALEIADLFGAFEQPPAPEEQIFDQIVEMRQQLADMQDAMFERFDNIESQLNAIYGAVSFGFNEIGDQIGDLSESVADLNLQIAEQRATLERIEDALWGMAQDLLEIDLAILTDGILDYRDDGGGDLPYSQGDPDFFDAASNLFTFATTGAANVTYAGPATLTPGFFDLASQLLDEGTQQMPVFSIGRQINNLRLFPPTLPGAGGPLISGNNVVASAPWTQAASAYAQLARENPWYFAYLYEQQLPQVQDPDLKRIITAGERLATMITNGRRQALFDALFAGHNSVQAQVLTHEQNTITDIRNESMVPYVDPFGGLTQPGVAQGLYNQVGPVPTLMPTDGATLPVTMPNNADSWNIFYRAETIQGQPAVDQAEIAHALAHGRYLVEGGTKLVSCEWGAYRRSNAIPNDFQIRVRFILEVNLTGGETIYEFIERRINVEAWAFIFGEWHPETVDTDQDAVEIMERTYCNAPCDSPHAEVSGMDGLMFRLTNGQPVAGSQVLLWVPSQLVVSGSPRRYELISESYSTLGTAITQLEYQQERIWQRLVDDPGNHLQDLQDDMLNWVALLDAYATLSLPDLFENSSVARSAFRGVPSSDSLALRVDMFDYYTQHLLNTQNPLTFTYADPFPTIGGYFGDRSALAQAEVNAALMMPPAGHGYIGWMLAELRDLRDNAFNLAIDDMYELTSPVLSVTAATQGSGPCNDRYLTGLLANDIDQPCRIISVDPATVTQPMFGDVVVNPDGSFTYTLDPGIDFEDLEGFEDSFTYQSSTAVNNAPFGMEGPLVVHSDPATVVIRTPLQPVPPTPIIHVPGDCPTIQLAVNIAPNNGIVELADGTYTGPGNRAITLGGKDLTIRSASGDPMLCIIDCQQAGRAFTFDGAEHVTLSGLGIINACNTTGDGGGAIRSNGTLTIEDCRFDSCVADNPGAMIGSAFGGAIFILPDSGQTLITNTTFSNCAIGPTPLHPAGDDGGRGGAIAIDGAGSGSIHIDACTFDNNISTASASLPRGGALYAFNAATVTLTNTTLSGNHCGSFGSGGAIFADTSSIISLIGCSLDGNSSAFFGGAIYMLNGGLTIDRCTISNSTAPQGATAVWLAGVPSGGAVPNRITNSLIVGNTGGPALEISILSTIPIEIINTTIAGNSSPSLGAGLSVVNSSINLHNSVLYFNEGSGGQNQVAQFGHSGTGTISIQFCNIQGSSPGVLLGESGNINADPLFVNALAGDFRLGPGSPSIDAGDNALLPGGLTLDLDGEVRFFDDPDTADTGQGTPPIVDMGAYEFQPPSTICPGDATGDNMVNIGDLNVVLGNFQQSGAPGIPGDLNSDGVVNILDLNIVLGNFQLNCT